LKTTRNSLDAGALTWGFVTGLILGGLIMLFRAPRSGLATRRQISSTGQQLRTQIETALTPVDPVAESLAEGKAAARRRRAELGLNE
jgi:gas vesicle protein